MSDPCSFRPCPIDTLKMRFVIAFFTNSTGSGPKSWNFFYNETSHSYNDPPGSSTDFLAAIQLVQNVDITLIPYGSVQWFWFTTSTSSYTSSGLDTLAAFNAIWLGGNPGGRLDETGLYGQVGGRVVMRSQAVVPFGTEWNLSWSGLPLSGASLACVIGNHNGVGAIPLNTEGFLKSGVKAGPNNCPNADHGLIPGYVGSANPPHRIYPDVGAGGCDPGVECALSANIPPYIYWDNGPGTISALPQARIEIGNGGC